MRTHLKNGLKIECFLCDDLVRERVSISKSNQQTTNNHIQQSAPLRLRSPAANWLPRSPRPPANAVPSIALHLLTSADHQCHESNPLNSARLSLHLLYFVTLSFRSVGSAVQRKRNQVGASHAQPGGLESRLIPACTALDPS